MSEIWIKEAEDLTPAGTPGAMSGVGGPRATLHCTVSQPGSFNAMHRVLVGKKSEPHLLYDPLTDRLGQYFPLNKSARALLGSPAVSPSHNKAGTVNIQVEVCAMPTDWTKGWVPGPNFRAMMRAIRSHGVKDRFVFRLPRNGTATERNTVARSRSVVNGAAGGGLWWGHCHYPSPEIHWDPGPIDTARFFGAATQEDDVTPQDIKDIAEATRLAVWRSVVTLEDGTELTAGQALQLATRTSLAGVSPDRTKALISGITDALGAGFDAEVTLKPKVVEK